MNIWEPGFYGVKRVFGNVSGDKKIEIYRDMGSVFWWNRILEKHRNFFSRSI